MCSGKQKLSGCITVVTVNLIIWGAIVSFIIVYHIPRDTRSSSENDVHNTSAAENETQLLTTNGSNDTAPGQLLCSDDFYLDDERNVCFPECGEWAVYPKKLGVAMNTLVILSVIIGIIGGTMVILLSCFNSQKTFTFPSSLVRYQTASVMMYDVILLIGRTAPTKLFCNSRNLIESLQDPALFCSIMGVIIQYAYWLTTIWWFTHITAFCWVVRYPFLAHKFETSGNKKYLHFAAVLLGVVLPWISIGLILGAGGYTFASVPPIVCVPNSVNASFYFFIMPIIILQAAGTSLLTIIFWTIHKDTSENDVHNTSVQVGSAENETQLLTPNGDNNTAPGQLLCLDNFYLDDERNVCFPECGEWAVYPKELGVAMNTLVILSVIIGIIGGTMVLLLSCFNSRKAFTFPSSLVRYQTASVMMYDVILLIGRTAPTKLFCNSRNLIESLQDPAPFCNVLGVIIQYAYWLTTIWWFIHIAAIYWVVRYPFHAHKFENSGRQKCLHFTAVLLGVVLPWISIGAVLGAGGYTFASVPPIVCIPSTVNASFYYYLMPIVIVEATGTSLLTIILWTIYKGRKSVAKTGIQKIEIKILIVLCYFIGTGVFTFLTIALRFLQNTRPLEDFGAYFICESLGKSCDRSAVDRSIPDQILFDILQMIYGSFPAVNLLYAINIRELKQKWEHCHL